jgi:hypothetical protein
MFVDDIAHRGGNSRSAFFFSRKQVSKIRDEKNEGTE